MKTKAWPEWLTDIAASPCQCCHIRYGPRCNRAPPFRWHCAPKVSSTKMHSSGPAYFGGVGVGMGSFYVTCYCCWWCLSQHTPCTTAYPLVRHLGTCTFRSSPHPSAVRPSRTSSTNGRAKAGSGISLGDNRRSAGKVRRQPCCHFSLCPKIFAALMG